MKLNEERLKSLLEKIPSLKIGLIGDGCVDIYWEADLRLSELSRESPHFPLPVVEERFSLGAGTNVVANLAALGVTGLRYISSVGRDWRGTLLERLLNKIGVSTEHLVSSGEILTPAYCKPIRKGISDVRYEDPRIDFANRKPIPEAVELRLMDELEKAADACDLLIVCDQFAYGCITEKIIDRICEIGEKIPVIVDSRDRISVYKNVVIKPNEVEAGACLNLPPLKTREQVEPTARRLEEKTGRPVVITMGEKGAVFCKNGCLTSVPAFHVEPPIDFVGAGDAFLSAFSVAFALQADPESALEFACLASSVTIKKLNVTGTAAPEELIAALKQHAVNAG